MSATLCCHLCLQNNNTCIPIPNKWSCQYCLPLGVECIFIPPIPNYDLTVALLSRNCIECIRSHRLCAFIDPTSKKCTQCTKRHLKCYFKFSKCDHQNDLSPRSNIYPTPTQDSTSSQPPNCAKGDCFFDSLSTEIELNEDVMSWCGIVSDPGVSFFATSDRLHYVPLIHANVSSGASCCACFEESYHDLDVQCLPVYVSPGVPPSSL
jgi:hypothetical protein